MSQPAGSTARQRSSFNSFNIGRPSAAHQAYSETRDLAFLQTAAAVRPENRTINLLRAGRTDEALSIAARRLRSSGLSPAPIHWDADFTDIDPTRLAAALLIPVAPANLSDLWNLVRRQTRDEMITTNPDLPEALKHA